MARAEVQNIATVSASRSTADRTRVAAFAKPAAAYAAQRFRSMSPDSDTCSSASSASANGAATVSQCLAVAPWKKAGGAAQRRRRQAGAISCSSSDDDSTRGPLSTASGTSWTVCSPTASMDGSSSDSGEEEVSPGSALVYSITMLLAARATLSAGASSVPRRGRLCSVLGYTVRAEADLPESLLPAASEVSSPFRSSSSTTAVSGLDEEVESERILRAVRSTLNKLTVEKFDALYEQLATCGIATEAHLQSVVCEVFEKATAQHHFIPMYADLCARLESEERIAVSQDGFRRLLLCRCQRAFEELLEPGQSPTANAAEDEEAALVRKQRALGNVKLVGQLLVRGMLSSRLVVQCSQDLLEARAQCPGALEFLAAFLTVAAPTFDTPKFAQHAQLQAILKRLEELAADKASVAPRERFLLRDLVDLRKVGWAGRQIAAKPSAPMRLEDVRAAAMAATGSCASPSRSGSSPSWAASSPPSSPWSRSPKTADGAKQAVFSGGRFGHGSAGRSPAAPLSLVSQQPPQQQPRITKARTTPAPSSNNEVLAAAAPPRPQRAALTPAPAAAAATPSLVEEAKIPTAAPVPKGPFDPRAFRRVISEAMKELAAGASVPSVVRRIREQGVPVARQAAEFSDILTRAAEERRGPVRRTAFAFAVALAAADGTSAFDRSACIEGAGLFFSEVYPDLCEEVPRLSFIMKAELLPTLRSVLPTASLQRAVPEDLLS